MAHAIEEGDTILVLIEAKELCEDLLGFLCKGRMHESVRLPQKPGESGLQVPPEKPSTQSTNILSHKPGLVTLFSRTPDEGFGHELPV
jgi:hypothetical protein